MTQSETMTRADEQLSNSAGAPGAVDPHHKRRLTPRRLMTAGVVVVVVGGGLGAWFGTRPASSSTATTRIVTVGYGTITQTASATGTIAAANTADLSFGVSGRVTAVDVTVGQTVTVGQALATVDPTSLQAEVDQAQASLDSAEAKRSSDAAATSDSAAQVTADNSAVTAAQAALTAAQDSLGDATLTSTVAGTVASLDLEVGQQVSGTASSASNSAASSNSNSSANQSSFGASSTNAASSSDDSSGSSTAQVVVVGTGSYIVNASVDDTEVGELQTGDQAIITPEGATTAVYGQVASVGIVATQTSGVASFPVVIDVTGSPTGLYSGSTADIVITVKELQNVLEVPTAAVSFAGGSTAVVTDVDGKQTTQAVTLGTASGGETQVTSGLHAGEQVVERIVTITGGTAGTTRGGGTFSRSGFTGGGGGFTGGGGGFGGGGGGFGGGGG